MLGRLPAVLLLVVVACVGVDATVKVPIDSMNSIAGVRPVMRVSTLTLTPDTLALERGDTARVTCTPRNTHGTPLTNTCTWRSTDTAVAKVSTTLTQTMTVRAYKAGTSLVIGWVPKYSNLRDTTRVTVTDTVTPPTGCVSSATKGCPGDDLQAKIAALGAVTFTVGAGVHRHQTLVPKSGQTIQGEPGAILTGARVLTGWVQDGARWYVGGQTQQRGPAAVDPNNPRCETTSPRCDHAEDVWIDGVLLKHVSTLSGVASGTWFFDYAADRIYIGQNPAGKTVETNITEYAIHGSASNVTIRGLIIEKYANMAQTGAVGGTGAGSGWVIRNNEIRHNHGLAIRSGSGMQSLGNNIHHQGQMGIGGVGMALVDGDTLAYNNTDGFNPYWEAGGTKIVFTTGSVFRNIFTHHNHGHGLWSDISNVNHLYEKNLATDNDWSGIFYEVSYGAIIRNNVVKRNGIVHKPDYDAAGILVTTSPDVEVYGNTADTNWWGGIIAVNSDRGSGTQGVFELRNLHVHDNVIRQPSGLHIYAGVVGINAWNGIPQVFTSWNNRWTNNTYHTNLTAPFKSYNGTDLWSDTWTQWRAKGFDAGSTLSP
jgi:hypothetical protein